MRAIVKRRPGPGVELAEVPMPAAGPGQALLQVVVSGICGTDLHIVDWNPWAAGRVRPPRVIGHEMAGRVAALGAGASGLREGDLVGVESHLVDLTCRQCRQGLFHICADTRILGVDVDGTLAEWVVVPARNCRPAPAALDPELVAFQEPMGNAVHAALQGPLRDRVVVVTGCGPIGCAAVGVARAEGAGRVVAVDRAPHRLEMARQMGADAAVDAATADDLPARLREACGGAADVVLEMAGHPALIAAALAVLAPGGWISLLGLGDGPVALDLNQLVVMRQITLYGVTGRRQFETWDRTAEYLASGRVDPRPVLTHRFPADRHGEAFAVARSGQGGKVLIYPAGGAIP